MSRRFEALRRFFTPRTVLMQIGAREPALALRAAGYVERVWWVEPACRLEAAPCNLRQVPLERVPPGSVDVALSERLLHAEEVRRCLAPGGVWLLLGEVVPPRVLRAAGFARARYFSGGLRVPRALARLMPATTSAAYT